MNAPSLKVSSQLTLLDVGMYILRLTAESTSEKKITGCLSLHPAPAGKGVIDFFPGEGVTRNTLAKASDVVIVRVKGGPASLLITEYQLDAAAHGRLRLQIEQVANKQGVVRKSLPTAAKAVETPSAPDAPTDAAGAISSALLSTLSKTASPAKSQAVQSLKLLGHISTRGDVVVEDAWLGAPDSKLRIEGFAIAWAKQPEEVSIAYLCRTSKTSDPSIGLDGQFVGSRQQAKPLTSIAFVLSGSKADDYELSGQVVFAGQAPQTIIPDQELSGPTGTEPLVAIYLSVNSKAAQVSPPASPWDTSNAAVFRT
ncbi:hypothetical protein LX59_02623 [Azomonas agilis]|uniref:Uncharacterized protein n=2 Tax=Azomonas agilis TaxID=116849 RepID=A0A562I069_9GAMM|nr:hypothetical protein LX59_02623 [Azomonas agilis]